MAKTEPAAPTTETLEAAILAGVRANPVVTGPDGKHHLILPPNYSAKDLPNDGYLPPWPRKRVTVDDRASLSAYANRFSTGNSLLIADYDEMTVSARLDWHAHNQAADGFGASAPDAHSVTLKLRPSEEYQRWDQFEGDFHAQDEFAAFLEENAVDILSPEAATMIEISKDLEATTGQTFKSSIRLDNGDRAFRFESDTRVPNQVTVPTQFTLDIPLYHGEPPVQLNALFRWRATAAGLLLAFQWRRVEYQRRAHFEQIATTAAEETGLPLVFGRQG